MWSFVLTMIKQNDSYDDPHGAQINAPWAVTDGLLKECTCPHAQPAPVNVHFGICLSKIMLK